MPETRKNQLNIDGAQVKEDEHIGTYSTIPDTDLETSISKARSKEKLTSDGADEKLLQNSGQAKIVTRVDMADAKYVVEDHRNGDAKIELDASKKQFTGLTKEELMKYADDPFWIRLRWTMFVLFWALWLCMLAGAIGIIVSAPKCAAPTPKAWFEKAPVIESSQALTVDELSILETVKVQGMFLNHKGDPYQVLDDVTAMDQIRLFIQKAKDMGVKIVVDLTANFVSTEHKWFKLSENRSAEYDQFFIWLASKQFDDAGNPKPPNNWVSTTNESAWSYSEQRKEFYLHQYGAGTADLNFSNPQVVKQFDSVIKMFMEAGAGGIRLSKSRQLLVNASFLDESPRSGSGTDLSADHTQYSYWKHQFTTDQPQLDDLLMHWSYIVDHSGDNTGLGETVFTVKEEGSVPELYLLSRNVSSLRPPSASPINADQNPSQLADWINNRLKYWPFIQLKSEAGEEIAPFAMLLPAAPVLDLEQIAHIGNDTNASESLVHVIHLRNDASIEHGHNNVSSVPALNSTLQLLACARWKVGHTGYVGVWNPHSSPLDADVSSMPSVPNIVSVYHASHLVKGYANYTSNLALKSNNFLVPPKSSIILSYVPNTTAEE